MKPGLRLAATASTRVQGEESEGEPLFTLRITPAVPQDQKSQLPGAGSSIRRTAPRGTSEVT
jgi:hypothetical protein